MADQDDSLVIRPARGDDDLAPMVRRILTRAHHVRGGSALVAQIWGESVSDDEVEDRVGADIADRHVWIAESSGNLIASALHREGCIQVLWVEPAHRRRGIATALVNALLATEHAPSDAWALPGDRATKSLYESVGWKARLLTMRGA